MFDSIENGIGLDIVLALQDMRNGLFDFIAEAFDFMGNDIFFLLILPLAYWSINRRLGVKLLFALIFAGVSNAILKELFQTPRPYDISDEVQHWVGQYRYGLPSGHVMNAVIVWGYLALELRQRWFYWALGVFILIMAWSRMYLGVHFPQDVIGGVLFGGIGLWSYRWLEEHLPDVWVRLDIRPQLASIVLAIIALSTFVFADETGMALVGLLVGVSIGWMLNEAYHIDFSADGELRERGIRYFVGIILLSVLFFGLRLLFDAFTEEGSTLEALLRIPRYALIGMFAFTGFPYLALRLGLVPHETDTPQSAKID